MNKVNTYREILKTLDKWDPFLLRESGLPGKRANLELAQAVAEEGNNELFMRYLTFNPEKAPVNSPHEFLAFCGILGLRKLLVEGKSEVFKILRLYASDPRWRIREGVALALQHFGKMDMDALLQEMEEWSKGNLLEKRAVAAALCEPALLCKEKHILIVFQILDEITTSIANVKDRKTYEFKALRKGMGYCWSVVVAVFPEKGKEIIERWFSTDDKDVLWIMKENLRKKRLCRMDPKWVENWKTKLRM